MKILIAVLVVLCLIRTTSKAQQTAKVHFLNLVVGANAEVKTTVDQRKPILLKSRTWTVIQPAGDSLGLVVDGKPYFIHFDPDKQYYFVIQSSYTSRPVVTEKSEREFIMTAAINSVKGPEEVITTRLTN